MPPANSSSAKGCRNSLCAPSPGKSASPNRSCAASSRGSGSWSARAWPPGCKRRTHTSTRSVRPPGTRWTPCCACPPPCTTPSMRWAGNSPRTFPIIRRRSTRSMPNGVRSASASVPFLCGASMRGTCSARRITGCWKNSSGRISPSATATAKLRCACSLPSCAVPPPRKAGRRPNWCGRRWRKSSRNTAIRAAAK